MPKCLNSSKIYIELMGENISGESTLLENTVRRLASDLGISLQDTAGISYECAIEGSKGIRFDYHRDFDGYESFVSFNGHARFAVSKVRDGYLLDLRNTGRNLFKSASIPPMNGIERKINLRLLAEDIRSELETMHEPFINISESDIDLITAETVIKYLS